MLNRRIFSPFASRVLVLFALAAFLSGCSWMGKKTEPPPPVPTPETLYQEGVTLYKKKDYMEAATAFQQIKDQYPLSPVAIMAELGIADALFSQEKYIEAEATYTDFLNLHPANSNLPYIVYQLGLCHYKQIVSIDRDQSETMKAKKEFDRLSSLYPDSQYTFMAERLVNDCKRRLAEHEFYIGRFYLKMKKYQAALKRFETVARDYPNLGLDFKVGYFLKETKRLMEEEKKKPEVKKLRS